jgi:nucleoside-diphosphate-sugar epimerase
MPGTVLVTGAAGYVGSIVVTELLDRGWSVRAFDALIHGGTPSLLPAWGRERFRFIYGDVRREELRRRALRGADCVVHLAAIVGDPACARQQDRAREVNLDATRALLAEAEAEGVRRFLFASTCSNYGRMSNGSFATEDLELRPISLYAETKVAAEHEVLANGSGSMQRCCLRFATVFGVSPRMRFDLTVNEFTRDVSLRRHLVVYGEQFWRPYVHVRDAARAAALALEAPDEAVSGEVFNVGATRENYRKSDIVDLLRERFPDATFESVHRDEDPRDYRVSFEKLGERLGFEARRSVVDGIEEIAALLQAGVIADPYAAVYVN